MNASRVNRIRCIVVMIIVCLTVSLGGAQQDNRARLTRLVLNEVYVDYGVGIDPPLVKTKFNLYDAVIPSMEQFVNAVQIMGELNVETYRIELAWGRRSGYGLQNMITGSPEAMVYDFSALDRIVTDLKKQNVLLHGAYGYCPYPLQDVSADGGAPAGRRGGGRSRAGSAAPNDMARWKEICATVANHYLDMGIRMGVNEVWNEPDGLMSFFSGTEQEYQQMYKAAVEGIRAVDPDAFVAGPASAPELVWHRSFPEYVAREKLPIDAFTFHHYGSGELGRNMIDKVKASLDRFDHFKTTDMVMDEWHSADLIEPWCRDDDVRSTYEGASQLLSDFDVWLSRPELTAVSWAWYLDPARRGPTCMGLITGDGHRKAVFNAWKIYGRMPVDRKEVRMIGPLRAMASADEHNAAVAIWNPDPYQRRIDVHLSNLPFAKGNARVYWIDKLHASHGDGAPENLAVEESFENVDLGTHWTWLDHIIPAHGTIYIELDDGSGLSELAPVEVANVIKVNHYYPDRDTSAYADFDRKAWIARLGMANDRTANKQVTVLADGLPDTLKTRVVVEGTLKQLNINSLLGVRVDYRVGQDHPKAVLWHGPYKGVDLYSSQRNADMPWGTKRQADEVVAVEDLAAFEIGLKQHAPENWQGKAQITFILQNAGAGARAKIILRRP
ncbi:MAG: hypothetical protein JW993_16705 [Sedimentisphaerales bacterium]|nr:hypothetical protein [Sedimentisphaerales bacterium]